MAKLRKAGADAVEAALTRVRADEAEPADLRLLTKHFLAVLEERAPGRAVEVRVPPYAAVQVIGGTTHTRGTPPAVVELDGLTWVGLAAGDVAWAEAVDDGRVHASGERSSLADWLPLLDRTHD